MYMHQAKMLNLGHGANYIPTVQYIPTDKQNIPHIIVVRYIDYEFVIVALTIRT